MTNDKNCFLVDFNRLEWNLKNVYPGGKASGINLCERLKK